MKTKNNREADSMDRKKAIEAHKEARKKLLVAGLIDSKVFLRPVKPPSKRLTKEQTAALLKDLER